MNGDTGSAIVAGSALLQPAAASHALRVDALFGAMVLLCGGVALLLFGLMLVFAVRYRRGARRDRSRPRRNLPWLEAAWTLTPLAIFIVIFDRAADDYTALYRQPADALPVAVVARQWMWKLQHRNGKREINELHVPLGQPVLLTMSAQDAIHSFYVPAFRIKQDVLPGRYTRLWFSASRLGEFRLFCAEYCGAEHSRMIGRIVVMPPADFSRWLDAGAAQPSLAQYGFALVRQLGCSGCHAAASTVHAPLLDGLPGRLVRLQDGRSVVADDNYLRDAILLPRKDVVAGFDPLMPAYAGQVGEDELQALIAYLHSTADDRRASPGAVR